MIILFSWRRGDSLASANGAGPAKGISHQTDHLDHNHPIDRFQHFSKIFFLCSADPPSPSSLQPWSQVARSGKCSEELENTGNTRVDSLTHVMSAPALRHTSNFQFWFTGLGHCPSSQLQMDLT